MMYFGADRRQLMTMMEGNFSILSFTNCIVSFLTFAVEKLSQKFDILSIAVSLHAFDNDRQSFEGTFHLLLKLSSGPNPVKLAFLGLTLELFCTLRKCKYNFFINTR